MKTPEIRAVIPNRISIVWPVTVGGVAVVIFLAIWFRAEFSILLLGAGGLLLGTGSAWLIGRFRRGFVAGLLEIETIKQARATTNRLQIEAKVIETRHGLFVDGDALRYIPPTVTERRALESGQIIEGEATERQRTALELFEREKCVAILGPRGAGKTELGFWFLSYRRGLRLVCDPKGIAINRWPGAYVAQDNASIVDMVNRVAGQLRYRRENNLRNEQEINLFIDELFDLVKMQGLPIMRPVFWIASLGREYNINVAFTTNDFGVKTLEVEGMSGQKAHFALVEIRRDRFTEHRQAWLIDSRERTPLILPGKFVGGDLPKVWQGRAVEAAPTEQPTAKQAAALAMWDEGERDTGAIARAVYGYDGGRQVELVNNAIGKFRR